MKHRQLIKDTAGVAYDESQDEEERNGRQVVDNNWGAWKEGPFVFKGIA